MSRVNKIFFLIIVLTLNIYAVPVVSIDSDTTKINLSKEAEVFFDSEHRYTYQDLMREPHTDALFRPIESNAVSVGYSSDNIWIRFNLRNVDTVPFSGVIELPIPWINFIDVYIQDKETLSVKELGANRPFSNREIAASAFLIPVTVAPSETTTFYISIHGKDSLVIAPHLYNADEADELRIHNTLFNGILMGIIFIMIVYNFFTFFYHRDYNYLRYALYLTGIFFFMGVYYGYNMQFLWRDYHLFNYSAIAIIVPYSFAASILLTRYFLETYSVFPKVDLFLRFLMYLLLVVGTVNTFMGRSLLLTNFVVVLISVNAVALIGVSIAAWRKRIQGSGYFLIAWSISMINAFFASQMTQGNIDFSHDFYRAYGIFLIVDISILLFALSSRNAHLRNQLVTEKSRIQNKLLQREQETSRKLQQSNEQLEKAKEHAESATRAKSVFLANMSHEIRTPMNAVIGMTALALETEHNEKQKNYIEKAHIAAENLLGIINDILDYSKIEAGRLELSSNHFELKNIISHTLHLISVAAKDKQLHTRVKMEKDVPPIYFADDLRLGQVLTNLATNAVKFSHDGGNVTLGISLIEERETDVLVQFSVEDEGIGISAEQQKKLFRSFSQADSSTQRKFGGTGLGLAISQRIVEQMGGEIWVESEEGQGSTFFFTVRMQKSDETAITEVAKESKETMQLAIEKLHGSAILLVEDNEMNQELAEDLLKRNGMHVVIANNGQEALEILEEQDFDGVLMDCQMPVMDGYEATRKIRAQEKYKELPIFAMTANVMEEDREKAMKSGMNDHIAKPIVPADMFTTMAKWMPTKRQ